jgi:hypothetical protein
VADNVVLNAGSGGVTLATDDIGGTHYQIVKLSFGALDTATPVSGANPLPVVQTGTHTVTGAGGTFPVTAAVGAPAFVQLSDGAAAITTLPVSLAAVPSHAVTKAGTFAVQAAQSGTWNVTVNSAIAAGNNNIGDVDIASIAAGTNNIGDVDVLTVPADPFGVNADAASATGSISAKLRFIAATGIPITGTVTVGTHAVTQSGSWSLAANQSVNNAQINGVTPLMGNGVTGTGSQRVTIASDNTAFSVNAVQSGTWTVQPGNTANTTAWLVNDQPATSGGLSFSAVPVSAATNNKTQAKASAGQLYSISAQNISASVRYLKIFNNTSAGVTMGTTACDYQFIIPGSTTGAGVVINIDKGIAMGTGITYAITGSISATDNTSIGASEVSVLIGYK